MCPDSTRRPGIARRDLLRVSLTALLALAAQQPALAAAQEGTGTISGRVFNRQNGVGLPGAIVTVGYATQQRATVTDGNGRYRFTGIAPGRLLDVITFLPGFTYLLENRDLAPGGDITVDFGIFPEPNPNLIPVIEEARISANSVEPGQSVTFTMRVRPGSEVPLSPEVLVMNPLLGRMVLLKPDGDVWRASWTAPATLAEGSYVWTFLAVDEACREPNVFPTLPLEVIAPRLVPETGKTVPGVFRHYWNTRGGLGLYGYPISDAFEEVNPADNKTYLVQYFERNRFEYHPENGGTRYEVLLGLLGRQVTAGRESEPPFQRIAPFADTPERRYFEATGHSLSSALGFLQYWNDHGGLEQFGYPISEEFEEVNAEDRRTYRVQYFERARFEHHPENPPETRVLLGLLGKQVYARR